jgi:hypothetical protein
MFIDIKQLTSVSNKRTEGANYTTVNVKYPYHVTMSPIQGDT